MARAKKPVATPAPAPEVKEPKAVKGEYRVVGIYLGQNIDRVYTDKELAEGFAKKINGKVI